MEKKEFLELEKSEQDYIKMVYTSRVEYLELLMNGLREWKMMDKDEEKTVKKIISKLEDYQNYLIDVLEYQQ